MWVIKEPKPQSMGRFWDSNKSIHLVSWPSCSALVLCVVLHVGDRDTGQLCLPACCVAFWDAGSEDIAALTIPVPWWWWTTHSAWMEQKDEVQMRNTFLLCSSGELGHHWYKLVPLLSLMKLVPFNISAKNRDTFGKVHITTEMYLHSLRSNFLPICFLSVLSASFLPLHYYIMPQTAQSS